MTVMQVQASPRGVATCQEPQVPGLDLQHAFPSHLLPTQASMARAWDCPWGLGNGAVTHKRKDTLTEKRTCRV